jgi:hypothetical protein
MSSYATTSSSQDYNYDEDPYAYESSSQTYDDGSYALDSTSATLIDSGTGGLVDLGNEYEDNEAVGDLVVGSQADVYQTQANMGAALAYNNAMMDSMYSYNVGLERQKTGNTATLMSLEGSINQELMYDQGAINESLTRVQGDEQRATVRTTGRQNRMQSRTDGQQTRKTTRVQGEETRKTTDNQYENELMMRNDARGAVAAQNATYFG